MNARKYVQVIVAPNGKQPQAYNVPADQAGDFAAERYVHYQTDLGKYLDSQRITDADGTNGIHDRFTHGYIFIAE